MSEPTRPWVRIDSGALSAEIDPHGAQLSVLRDRESRDLLWNGDAAVWAGRAPLLFPIVGALAGGQYRLGEERYALSRHGFARGKDFAVAEATATTAVFRLTADATTRAVYPFDFELAVAFGVVGSTLSITTTLVNGGDVELPASIGYHPALRWPLPYGQARASHVIEFDRDEPSPIRRLDAAGLLTAEPQPTPIVKRRLALQDALFETDVVILDDLRSRSVSYGAEGAPHVRVGFPDAAYLGLWSKPGAGFICIEPWHGIADPAGFSGDFRDKPGIVRVPPGAQFSTTMTLSVIDP